MLAAERLFGERGIAAVSMREVAAAAGQGNTSAVRYHFGSRDGLVEAVFAYRMARIDERRRVLVADLGLPGAVDVDLRALVEALVFPLAESVGRDGTAGWYLRFLRQVAFVTDVDLAAAPLAEVTWGLRTVVEAITAQLVHLPPALRDERVVRATELAVHALADHEVRLSAGRARVSTPLLTADLVDAVVAVLGAEPSRRTLDVLDRGGDTAPVRGGPQSGEPAGEQGQVQGR